MATPLGFATGDAQTVKIWSKALTVATIQKTFYRKFSATNDSMPFQILTDLTKGSGDQIKFDLLQQMSGFGVNANAAMINQLPGVSTNESNMRFVQETIEIEQKRLAHAWYRMSSQRSVHDLMKAAMSNLSDRWAVIIDKYAAAHLVGVGAAGLHANDTDGVATTTDIAAHTSAVENHDAMHIYATAVASPFEAATHISPARWKAETITDPAPIQRIMVDGNETYVMFIRPEQAASLTADADWIAAQTAGNVRGASNPVFSGALGTWNGIVVHMWTHLPYGIATTGPTVRYAVLVGRQALTIAFGNAFDSLDQEKYGKDFVFAFVPRDQSDYGNIKGISAGCVFGMRRTMYDSLTPGTQRSFASIQVQSTDAAIT